MGTEAMDPAEHTRHTREVYDRLAPVWSADTDAGPFNGLLERPALRLLIPRPLRGRSVLDAGCGAGAQCEWLLDEGAEVTGIDLSPGMVEQARLRCGDRARFAVADLARYQLMNQRTIPEFKPSEDAYAVSVTAYEQMSAALRERGVRSQADLDLWTALLGGFVDQQLANEPGGSRWRRQLPRLVDMYCDEVGVPGPRLRRAR